MLKVPCPAKKCFADLQIFQCFCTLGVSNLIPSKTLPLANSTSPASAHSAHSATQRVGVPAAPVTVTQGAPRTSSTASPLSMATSTDRAWTRKKNDRIGMLPKMNKDDYTVTTIYYNILQYIAIYYYNILQYRKDASIDCKDCKVLLITALIRE